MKNPPHIRAAAKPLHKRSVKPAHTPEQIEMAMGACRTIKFAAADSRRRNGTWDLNSLLAAERLALVALGDRKTLEDCP